MKFLQKKNDRNKIKPTRAKSSKRQIETWGYCCSRKFFKIGRSTKDLIDLVNYFEEKNVKLISVKENFDATTPQEVNDDCFSSF